MNRLRTACLALALFAATAASAQRATEVYIPIGESPGVSDSDSVLGTIESVEYERHRMTVVVDGETRVVALTPDTRYYLDRSDSKERNVAGTVEDCRAGRRIEAWLDADGEAIWVKIDAG